MYIHKFRDTNENKYSAEDNAVIIKMKFFFFPLCCTAFGNSVPRPGSGNESPYLKLLGSGNESLYLKLLGHQGTPSTMLILKEVEKSNQIAM